RPEQHVGVTFPGEGRPETPAPSDGAPAGSGDRSASHAAAGAPGPAEGSLRDLSLQDLVRRVADHTKTLLRRELALAGTEIGSKLKTAGKGAGTLGVAGIVAVFAACALVAGLILGVATVVSGWVAGIAVTLLLAVVGGLLAVRGREAVHEATPLVPERAMEALASTRAAVTGAWRTGAQGAAPRRDTPRPDDPPSPGATAEGLRTVRLPEAAPDAPASSWRPKTPPRY
ncbi:MAG: phage holin family protein, partial [Actinomycetota bacterium]